MPIYNAKHPGKVLTTPDITQLLDEAKFQGFLSAADINALINQPDCIGIRVYSASLSLSDTAKRVMAVGVRVNGTEKDGRGGVGYVVSQPFNKNNVANGQKVPTRNAARNFADFGARTSTLPRMASFFSAEMLKNLLKSKDNKTVAGIGFYVGKLDTNPQSTITTHIGASFINDNGLTRLTNNPGQSHIQSDMPCPGKCAVLSSADTTLGPGAETQLVAVPEGVGVYLIKW